MSVDRFRLEKEYDDLFVSTFAYAHMSRHSEGDYVLYSDYLDSINRYKERILELEHMLYNSSLGTP